MSTRILRIYIGDVLEVHWLDPTNKFDEYIVRYTAPPSETRRVLKKLKERAEEEDDES